MRAAALQTAGYDLATCYANMCLEGTVSTVGQRYQSFMNIKRGAGSSQRIVFMRFGGAEQRHHRVADVLVYSSAIAGDDPINQSRVSCHQLADLLGIQ